MRCSTSGESRADIARYVCLITMLINKKTRKEGEEGNKRMNSSYSTVTDFAKFRGKST